jgi:hypothetical protein
VAEWTRPCVRQWTDLLVLVRRAWSQCKLRLCERMRIPLTLVEHDRRVVRGRRRAERALVADRDRIHRLQCASAFLTVRICRAARLRVPANLARRRAGVHHERVTEPVTGRAVCTARRRRDGRTHFSRPSPTAIMRLLSPSHSTSLLARADASGVARGVRRTQGRRTSCPR